MATVISTIPAGRQAGTMHSGWVQVLCRGLFGPKADADQNFVVPLFEKKEAVALLGWKFGEQSGMAEELPVIRRIFQGRYALEKANTEAKALRWVLGCSDRATAVARPDGNLLGVSPYGSDLLKSLKHGERYYLHGDEPALPAPLQKALTQSISGQVKLTRHCTARFEALNLPGTELAPVVGIEFFSNSTRDNAPALTLLTAIERDVLERMSTGATNREIAQGRGTSPATIKNQVSEILRKFRMTRRNEVIAAQAAYRVQLPVAGSSNSSGGTFMTR